MVSTMQAALGDLSAENEPTSSVKLPDGCTSHRPAADRSDACPCRNVAGKGYGDSRWPLLERTPSYLDGSHRLILVSISTSVGVLTSTDVPTSSRRNKVTSLASSCMS